MGGLNIHTLCYNQYSLVYTSCMKLISHYTFSSMVYQLTAGFLNQNVIVLTSYPTIRGSNYTHPCVLYTTFVYKSFCHCPPLSGDSAKHWTLTSKQKHLRCNDLRHCNTF